MDGQRPTRHIRGEQAEQAALQHLQAAGLRLLQRNFRCRRGEIDLIMRDDENLVFVEVRYRGNDYFGGAAESVDTRKQEKLMLSAEHYMQKHAKTAKLAARFDVVCIDGQARLEWIRDAFEAW